MDQPQPPVQQPVKQVVETRVVKLLPPPIKLRPEFEESTEDKEVQAAYNNSTTVKYRLTPKYKRWLELFLDKDNKYNQKTFGNQTKSALIAYNLDPDTQYSVASTIGSENYRKHENLGALYLDKQGVTYGKMLEVLWNKMLAAKNENLVYTLAEAIGIKLPAYRPVSNPVFLQQTNYTDNSVNNTFTTLKDDQLKQLIQSKRTALRGTSLTGSGEEIQAESLEVHAPTPEATGSEPIGETSEGTLLGKQSG